MEFFVVMFIWFLFSVGLSYISLELSVYLGYIPIMIITIIFIIKAIVNSLRPKYKKIVIRKGNHRAWLHISPFWL